MDAFLTQEGDERDSLDGLTKAHLVCKDAIETILVQRREPLQTFQLICPHQASSDRVRLLR